MSNKQPGKNAITVCGHCCIDMHTYGDVPAPGKLNVV